MTFAMIFVILVLVIPLILVFLNRLRERTIYTAGPIGSTLLGFRSPRRPPM